VFSFVLRRVRADEIQSARSTVALATHRLTVAADFKAINQTSDLHHFACPTPRRQWPDREDRTCNFLQLTGARAGIQSV
jgi:hypothetical protein